MSIHPYRVLLVDLARSFGGAEVRVLAQAEALQSVVASCSVAVLEGSELHKRLQALDLPYEALSTSRASPQIVFALRDIIRRGGYQVVDAHNVQSIFWGQFAAF